FEPHPQICDQPHRHVVLAASGDRLVVALPDVRPLGRRLTVVEDRLAVETQLDPAHDAAGGADQHVLRLLVSWWAPVGARGAAPVNRGPEDTALPTPHPPGRSPPGRPRDGGAGQAPPPRRHHRPGGPEAEAAGCPIEHRAEDTAPVGPWQAQPLNPPARRD